MKDTVTTVGKCRESLIGSNQCFNVPECFLSPFTNVMANNAGDPFLAGGIGLSFRPKWMERGVLNYYASLWNAKWPHDPTDPESYILGLCAHNGLN